MISLNMLLIVVLLITSLQVSDFLELSNKDKAFNFWVIFLLREQTQSESAL